MTTYSRAPEVAKIAADLIRDVEMHKGLDEARIEYVWRDKAAKSKGRIILARARKVGGLNAFLVNISGGLVDADANEPLFVVEVALDMWGRLTPAQHVALVDHELCHLWCEMDEEGMPELGTRGHDLEEFSCIVARHGLWKGDVESFGNEVIGQLALAIEADAKFLDDLGIDPDGKDPRSEGDES
jgi:predicted metallopeptidase